MLARAVARMFGAPTVVFGLDTVDANIARLQATCNAVGSATVLVECDGLLDGRQPGHLRPGESSMRARRR
jgi:hypothetical protein